MSARRCAGLRSSGNAARHCHRSESLSGQALIAHINRAINLLIRPAPGAWVGALEVLTFADGDCKDYSIAKFFTLHEAASHRSELDL
jgi:predicted transglutaminase-like cysteine proteinase